MDLSNEEELTSKKISSIINFVNDVKSNYEFTKAQLEEYHKYELNFWHSIELDEFKYRDRAKLGTEASKIRKQRRKIKDLNEVLEPMYKFVTDNEPVLSKLLNGLSKVVGDTRKVEKYHSNRSYTPKTVNIIELTSLIKK